MQTAIFAVSLIVLLAVIVKAYSSDGQIEQTTRDEHTEQFTELESLTVDDVKFIVVETAMNIHRDGLMPEPRQIHAEEACKLWDVHGTSRPSGYWGDKIAEAEGLNMSNALPVFVVMRTLVELSERHLTARPAIAGYCNNVLRTQSQFEEREHRAPPGDESNILRLLERKAIFPTE